MNDDDRRAVRSMTRRVINYTWYDREFGMLLTQSQLLARGWTKSSIRKSLGEPDCYGRNPRGGAPRLALQRNRVRRVRLRDASA